MSRNRLALALLAAALLVPASGALAHFNSPDVFADRPIGDGRLFVAVHVPPAVPGEADVELRVQGHPLDGLHVRVRGIPPEGRAYAPPWTDAAPDEVDPAFFRAPLPLMTFGQWQAEIEIQDGDRTVSFRMPVAADVPAPAGMQPPLALLLGALSALLFVSAWQIMAGFATGSQPEHVPAPRAGGRRLRFALGGTLGLAAFFAFTGLNWKSFHDAFLRVSANPVVSRLDRVGPPPVAGKPCQLQLSVTHDGRPIDGVLSDGGKAMTAVIVERDTLAFVARVHPVLSRPGLFELAFVPPAGGGYRLFAETLLPGRDVNVVHDFEVLPGPGGWGATLGPDADDAAASFAAVGSRLGDPERELPDGSHLTLVPPDGPLVAGRPLRLEFEWSGDESELEPYLGATGQLLVIRADGQVFARVNPTGTAHGLMPPPDALPSEGAARLSFPYGFPQPGLHRLVVQVKHHGRILMAAFDVEVS